MVEEQQPESVEAARAGGLGTTWLRTCLYADDVYALYERTRDLLRFVTPPFTFEMGQYGPSRVALSLGGDGVLQEFLIIPSPPAG